MKGVIIILTFVFVLIGLNGCYTVPQHFAVEEEEVYYPPVDPYIPDPIIIIVDPPPPSPSIYYPPAPVVTQPHDRQPVKPPDSYGTRDPLQGYNHRGGGEINTVPPVRTPERKVEGRQ